MKFLVGLVVGAVLAAAIGAAALAVAFGELDDIKRPDRDTGSDVAHDFDLSDFDRIMVTGVYRLDVTVGPEFNVDISGPARELERVEATVRDGVLTLGTRDRERGEPRRLRKDGVTAKISMPALTGVSVAGVVDGDIRDVKADRFSIDLSGVGDLDIKGECLDLDAAVSGVGNLNAGDLKCLNVAVTVSGVGKANVYASESVSASVTGMGNINVDGSPKQVEQTGGMFSNVNIR